MSGIQTQDVQEQNDIRGVRLKRTGIKGLAVPLRVQGREGGSQHVTATVNIFSSLPENRRGVHLSRFMDVMHRFLSHAINQNTVRNMLAEINGSDADIEISFTYFIPKTSPVSGEKSFMDYQCALRGRRRGEQNNVMIQASVPMMTLCPDGKALTGCASHSQRGIVTVAAQGDVWIDDIVSVVESSGTELYQILKKADDKFVMEQTYRKPQFVEDLARDVVTGLRKDSRLERFSVSVETMESNHNYNAYAFAEGGVK